MPSYMPPVVNIVPPIYRDQDPWFPVSAVAQRLFRYYRSRAGGFNVYRLTNGTYTQNQPAAWSDVDRVFHAGHIEPVTEAELTALAAAGFPSAV